ncbi:nucleotidyltransferase domain-containing protein [Acidicapsa dinghuensis]|nr:nucleotidyltransferase family protein [Acidicapsa dinghuensis]
MRANTTVAPRRCSHEPVDEAALLITCLRGLPCIVPEDTNWELLLDLARENGVLLLLQQALLALGADVPGFFRDAAAECRAAAERLAGELECLLRGFQGLHVEALAFKGPTLALALYGDVTLRSSNDLDLLVRHDDFLRCEVWLINQGFIALGPASEHDRRFVRDGLLVELHFELAAYRDFPLDVDGIWRRSRPADFCGQFVRAMSDIDLVLYLCAHGLKHGFSRLIWILDVARSLHGWHRNAYEEMMRQARRQGLEPHLLIGCEVVRSMFPQQLPEALDAVIIMSPKAAKRARHAAARLFSENLEVVINDFRSFYLQAEPGALKRWRYRFGYLGPTYTDYLWARSHRIYPGLMVILRPFRLLHKYGLGRVWRVLFPEQ